MDSPSGKPRRRRRRFVPIVALVLAGAATLLTVLWAEVPHSPEVPYENVEYDGSFTLARIRFEPTVWGPGEFTWGLDLKWNHDYPQAEQNFSRILAELTDVVPNTTGSNILEITDPRLFEHPWAYICEVGFWDPTDEEAAILRDYLLKGGFLVVDDFIDMRGRYQFQNFERQMRRVLPEAHLVDLQLEHPVFHAFFPLEDLDFNDPRLPYLESHVFGIFENNDPNGRLMLVANYNMDIGDFWEWSDIDFYPANLTEKGFKLGLNYVIYGLTH